MAWNECFIEIAIRNIALIWSVQRHGLVASRNRQMLVFSLKSKVKRGAALFHWEATRVGHMQEKGRPLRPAGCSENRKKVKSFGRKWQENSVWLSLHEFARLKEHNSPYARAKTCNLNITLILFQVLLKPPCLPPRNESIHCSLQSSSIYGNKRQHRLCRWLVESENKTQDRNADDVSVDTDRHWWRVTGEERQQLLNCDTDFNMKSSRASCYLQLKLSLNRSWKTEQSQLNSRIHWHSDELS